MKKQILSAAVAGLVFTGCLPDDPTTPDPGEPAIDARFLAESYNPVTSQVSNLSGTWMVIATNIDAEFINANDTSEYGSYKGEIRELCDITVDDDTPGDGVLEHSSTCKILSTVKQSLDMQPPRFNLNDDGSVTIASENIDLALENNNTMSASHLFEGTVLHYETEVEVNLLLNMDIVAIKLSDSFNSVGTATISIDGGSHQIIIDNFLDTDMELAGTRENARNPFNPLRMEFVSRSDSGQGVNVRRGDAEINGDEVCQSISNMISASYLDDQTPRAVDDFGEPTDGACTPVNTDTSVTIDFVTNTASSVDVTATGEVFGPGVMIPFTVDVNLSLNQ